MKKIVYVVALVVAQTLCAEDWKADEYDKLAHNQFNFAVEELRSLKVTGHERVLDIGSGSGGLTAFLAQEVFKHGFVQGIDKSQEMIEFSRSHHADVSNIRFDQCCAESISYQEEFDVVLSFWVLHWVKNLDDAFAGIYRSLKPGGKALLCFMIERPTKPFDMLQQLLYSDRWVRFSVAYQNPLHLFPMESVIALAKNAQFVIDYAEMKTIYDVFDTLGDLEKLYRSIPLIDCIPVELRSEFYKEVMDMYAAHVMYDEQHRVLDGSPVIKLIITKA